MTEESLKKLSTEHLKSTKKGHNFLFWMLNGLAIVLLLFPLYDLLKGEEFEIMELTMSICCVGGALPLWEEIKKINKELATRNA
ncbi:MAG: hypothetical protein AAGJ18_09725 [Bacteroidota bacterium]